MKELASMAELQAFIHSNRFSFLFVSRKTCGVCHALLPQVEIMLQAFPEIKLAHLDADAVQEVAGTLMIFTVPVLLLYVDGKEYIREARFVHIELLQEKISKIYLN